MRSRLIRPLMAFWARGSTGFSEVSPRYKLPGLGEIHRSPCVPPDTSGDPRPPPASPSVLRPRCTLLVPAPCRLSATCVSRVPAHCQTALLCPDLWLGGPHPPRHSTGWPPAPPQPHAGTIGPVRAQPCGDHPGTPISTALSPAGRPHPAGLGALPARSTREPGTGWALAAGRVRSWRAPGSSTSPWRRAPARRLRPAGIRRQQPGLHPAGRARTWSAPAPESVTYFYF